MKYDPRNMQNNDTHIDTITGLPTLASIGNLVENSLNQNKQVGFLYFDVVQFHLIRDTYGRQSADALLSVMGRGLGAQKGKLFREGDLVAVGAPGTDYFVIFLFSPPRKKKSFSSADLKLISSRILQKVSNFVNSKAIDLGINEKIDFHSGYSVMHPEEGVSIERQIYETQRDAVMKSKLDEIMITFISNVTHELRTPLTCIKGYTETLLEGAVEDKELTYKWLGIINQEANRLERLINDLMDLSMIEAQQTEFSISQCNLLELLKHTIDVLTPNANKAGVRIKLEAPEHVPIMGLDKDRISQVFVNLVDNAIKYSPQDSDILISVSLLNRKNVIIKVIDHGIGIPDSQLSRVFERFYRVGKGRSARYGGRGLGLAIAKQIIEAHGGSIVVESAIEQGSIFTIELPVTSQTYVVNAPNVAMHQQPCSAQALSEASDKNSAAVNNSASIADKNKDKSKKQYLNLSEENKK